MEPNIQHTDDAANEFYAMIEDAAGNRGIKTEAHLYLTELLNSYTKLSESGPRVHTWDTPAFCLQLGHIEKETSFNHSQKYARFKNIGDTLLFSVGFIPESVSSIYRANNRNTERPPLEYYAHLGIRAYERAARERFRLRLCDGTGDMMKDIAGNFKQYAGLLFKVREDCEGLPLRRLDILIKMLELTKQKSIIEHFLLSNTINDDKKIVV